MLFVLFFFTISSSRPSLHSKIFIPKKEIKEERDTTPRPIVKHGPVEVVQQECKTGQGQYKDCLGKFRENNGDKYLYPKEDRPYIYDFNRPNPPKQHGCKTSLNPYLDCSGKFHENNGDEYLISEEENQDEQNKKKEHQTIHEENYYFPKGIRIDPKKVQVSQKCKTSLNPYKDCFGKFLENNEDEYLISEEENQDEQGYYYALEDEVELIPYLSYLSEDILY